MHMKLLVWAFALIIIAILISAGINFYTGKDLSEDAKGYVIEDLSVRQPGADLIEIISWEKRYNEEGEGYYLVKASVTEGYYTPCPERTHYYYFYPEQNFIPQPPEKITEGCEVCEGSGCVIAFREEAIIASHTSSGTEAVQSFIEKHADASPRVWEQPNGWLVHWTSEEAPYFYRVELKENGTLRRIGRVSCGMEEEVC